MRIHSLLVGGSEKQALSRRDAKFAPLSIHSPIMLTVVLPLLLLLAPTVAQTTLLVPATVGGSVLIPCSLPGYPLSLNWFYWQEDQHLLFHWDGVKTIPVQNNKYVNRTHVFNSGFGSGNISIRLHNISPEDDQKTYFAVVKIGSKPPQEQCRFMLQVSAPYQDLVLTVNNTANSATCRARGGYPEAQVSWKGLNRSNGEQLDLQDAEMFLLQDATEKTFSVTSSVNVTGLKSVTCVAYNPHSQETITRTREINAAAGKDHLGGFGIFAAIILPVLAVLGISVFWWIRIKRSKPNQQPERPAGPDGDQEENEMNG